MKKANFQLSTVTVHLLFAVLFIYALVFYKERLFSDSGYYIYRVVDEHFFAIGLNRFILLFSQVLPVIAVNIGCSLKTVLISYSLNHVLFFYVIFLISHYYYKNKNAGILLILIQTLGISHGFFTPMFELYYGVGFLVLLDVILNQEEHKLSDYIWMTVLAFIVLTSHPFTYFLLLFILLLHFLKYKWRYISYYISAIILIILVMVFKNYTETDYEQEKTKSLIYLLHNGIYNLEYVSSLAVFLFQYYKEMMLIALISVIYFSIKKEWVKQGVFLSGFLFFLILINLLNYGFENTRYQEQVYFPLSFIVGYTFIYYVYRYLQPSYGIVFFSLILLFVISRLTIIKTEATNYSYRVKTMEYLIEKCRALKGNKFVIRVADIIPKDGTITSWSYPMETMLLSGIMSSQKTITICTDDDMLTDNNQNKILPTEYMMRCWDIKEDKSVNQAYFHIEDGNYTFLYKK